MLKHKARVSFQLCCQTRQDHIRFLLRECVELVDKGLLKSVALTVRLPILPQVKPAMILFLNSYVLI